MSGQAAGVGRHPRLTSWLTFFQSYMLPLFFSILLSYLVGMKRRTSRCFTCKRDDSHFFHYLKNLSIMRLGIFLVIVLFFWEKTPKNTGIHILSKKNMRNFYLARITHSYEWMGTLISYTVKSVLIMHLGKSQEMVT